MKRSIFLFTMAACVFAGAELHRAPPVVAETVEATPLGLEGCNASSEQIHTTEQDGMKLAGCILAEVFGGVTDPGAIAGQCAGALPAVIVDVIDDFKAKAPDAGAAVESPQGMLLAQARTKAVAAMAQGAPGK